MKRNSLRREPASGRKRSEDGVVWCGEKVTEMMCESVCLCNTISANCTRFTLGMPVPVSKALPNSTLNVQFFRSLILMILCNQQN